AFDAARSATLAARVADDFAGAAACRAGPADREEALLIPDLTGTAAGLAPGGRAALSRARSIARLALLQPGDLDLGLESFGGFLERDFYIVPQVGPSLGAAPPAPAAEHVAEPE